MRASSLSGSNMFLDCSFLVRLESTLERNYGAWKICNNLESPGKHVLYLFVFGLEKDLTPSTFFLQLYYATSDLKARVTCSL